MLISFVFCLNLSLQIMFHFWLSSVAFSVIIGPHSRSLFDKNAFRAFQATGFCNLTILFFFVWNSRWINILFRLQFVEFWLELFIFGTIVTKNMLFCACIIAVSMLIGNWNWNFFFASHNAQYQNPMLIVCEAKRFNQFGWRAIMSDQFNQ